MALVLEGRVQEGIRELDPLQSYSEVTQYKTFNFDDIDNLFCLYRVQYRVANNTKHGQVS